MTTEVGMGNVSGSGLVRRRDESELKVGERSIREVLNFDKMSLSKIGVVHLGRLGRSDRKVFQIRDNLKRVWLKA